MNAMIFSDPSGPCPTSNPAASTVKITTLLILHGADIISLRIVEKDPRTDRWNVKLRQRNLSAVCFNRADDLIDVVNADGAFKTDHSRAGHRGLALVHQSSNARIFLIPGMDQVKLRRTPGFKPPSKHLFVETPRAADVVAVNRKAGEIVRH